MALTASPSIERKDGSYINYAVFNAGAGKIVDKLDLKKSCGIQGFRSSPNANRMLAGSLGDIRRRLKAYKTDLLFSSEGWLFQPRQWSEILHFLDVDVSIVVYVRPQVPVLNSAWWQWGAWSDQNFDDWMAHRLNASLWGARVKRWADLKCVKSVTVRPVPEEVVADFYEHVLDAPKPQLVLRPNPSLPGPVLRLFQRNRSLRSGIHASRMDFALANHLKISDPSIWVMNELWINRVLSKTQKDTELLLSFMDNDSSKKVREDSRWWSPAAYSDKNAASPNPEPISPEKLEELCVEMAHAIYDLEMEKLGKKGL